MFHFPRHSTERVIKIQYLKSLLDIEDENQLLTLSNCRVVLSKRTAGLAARYGNSNPTRADLLDMEAQKYVEMLTGIQVKTKQAVMGRRRKGWGSSRKASFV
jgi:hypothetical protein